jgi:hypothetical protein
VESGPTHPLSVAFVVIVETAESSAELFPAVKLILPVPLLDKPMAEFELVQLTVAPALGIVVKLTVAVAP